MNGIVAALVVVLTASVAHSKTKHLESWYADALAEQMAGARTEVRMKNGTRCDVLATHHAVEVEFAHKWAEAVGQSLNYAAQTGRAGAIALILESNSDAKFLARLREVIAWHQLPIAVIVLRPFGDAGLQLEFPPELSGAASKRTGGGSPPKARGSRALPVDLRQPVAAMDWMPRIRGFIAFEISTPNTNATTTR